MGPVDSNSCCRRRKLIRWKDEAQQSLEVQEVTRESAFPSMVILCYLGDGHVISEHVLHGLGK